MFFQLANPSKVMSTLILITLLGACGPAPDALEVSQAQVRDLVPGRDTTAGYFVLTNNTATEITLNGATSDLARAIEMHETVQRENSVGMQRVRTLTIKPSEQVRFETGGLHLMIFGVADIPDAFPITLTFTNGEQLDVTFSKLPL
jgi:copper(I)-binding protein